VPLPSPAPAHTGAIVGGVVGGIAGLALLAVVVFLILRRQRGPTRKAKSAYEMPHEMLHEEKHEMVPSAVEMPASDVPVSEKRQAPSHAHELDVQNDLIDQSLQQKPVSYA
jgi:hypothetical protein